VFNKRTKAEDFYLGDKVLKWDSRREDKGKHGKFDFPWKVQYIIYAYRGNNAYFLRELDGAEIEGGPVNVRMLKHTLTQVTNFTSSIVQIVSFIMFGVDWMVILELKLEEKALSFKSFTVINIKKVVK